MQRGSLVSRYAFGLFNEQEMVGVVTYGLPPSPQETMFWGDSLLELNRLCVVENLEKNVLSFFVSQSLKLLPDESVVISYADMDMGHSGYIYQSTNWLYTGIGSIGTKTYVMRDGKERHSRHEHLVDKSRVVETKISTGKHRYYRICG
jgi:hypothetical protein